MKTSVIILCKANLTKSTTKNCKCEQYKNKYSGKGHKAYVFGAAFSP